MVAPPAAAAAKQARIHGDRRGDVGFGRERVDAVEA